MKHEKKCDGKRMTCFNEIALEKRIHVCALSTFTTYTILCAPVPLIPCLRISPVQIIPMPVSLLLFINLLLLLLHMLKKQQGIILLPCCMCHENNVHVFTADLVMTRPINGVSATVSMHATDVANIGRRMGALILHVDAIVYPLCKTKPRRTRMCVPRDDASVITTQMTQQCM